MHFDGCILKIKFLDIVCVSVAEEPSNRTLEIVLSPRAKDFFPVLHIDHSDIGMRYGKFLEDIPHRHRLGTARF